MEREDVDLPSEQTVDVGDDAAPNPGTPDAQLPDFLLAAAVDDALIGDVLADLPEAQPTRSLQSVGDFSSLYVRHRSGLAAHARRYLRDVRDVDEVVQETFLRLFLAISEIETELQAIAFARRTLTNLCIDRYRADKRRPTMITLDASPYFDLTGADEDPDPVLQAEDAAIVRDALARLSPLHRAALVKREIEEKALPQIAAELGVAEESVKHLLFRARRALRRLLVGTSVEPGIDLTGMPPQRAGSPLLRNAPAFIFLLVAALVVGVGVRPLFSGGGSHAQPSTDAVGNPDLTLTGPDALAPKGMPPTAAPRHHPRHHRSPATAAASASSGSSPTIQINQPPAQHHHPKSHAPVGGHAPRGHFTLNGPLKVTGTPHVAQGGVIADQSGSTFAASSFSAATDHGRFELTQSVSTSSTGGTAVSVRPSFVVGTTVEQPDLAGSAASVDTDAKGNVTVDVVVNAVPDPSNNAFPLASVTARLVLSQDLDEVLSETVTLTTEPKTTAGPVTAGGAGSTSTGPTGAQPPPPTTSEPGCPGAGAPSTAGSGDPDPGQNCPPADTGSGDTVAGGTTATMRQ